MNQTMEVRILEGASALFYRFGFSRVRFSEIAREVGITTRTIYNYFPNKISLSKAVSEYTIKRVMNEIKTLTESDTTFFETIILILEKVYLELENRLPAYRKDAQIPGKGQPNLISVDPDIGDFITQLITRAIQEGVLDKDAPFETMMQILLNQVNYCFPADGAHSSLSINKGYFINSMVLIISTCATEYGRKQFRTFINK